MDTRGEIERIGFYPEVVLRTLRRHLGEEEPLAMVSQLDAAFDNDTMFRHLTVAALGATHLLQVHVDELDGGAAMVAAQLTALSQVRGVAVVETVADAATGPGTPQEVSVALNLGGQRRAEVEPVQCDDPECAVDHGYQASSYPDDLSLRISLAANGAEDLARAEHFVDVLVERLRGAR